jgi:hypothetical protein
VGVLVSVYYGLAGLACAVRFGASIGRGPWPALRAVILPGLSGLALLALGAFLAYTEWTSSRAFAWSAANGRFQAAIPIFIITAGVAASAWAKWGRRAPYFRRDQAAPAVPALPGQAVGAP